MDSQRHHGRIAIVTGAASGIGRATVLRMAREGAAVTGCDINETGLQETARLVAESGATMATVVADVTRQPDVDALVAQVGERVDILANVAGIMDHFLPLGEVDDETWNRVLDVNLNGVMRLTRAVLPRMEEAGRGAIVTVASEAALGAGASGVAYAVSKHGVLGLVKSVAFYYGPRGIRSNAVLPGPVDTAIGATSMPTAQWAIERAGVKLASMPPIAEPDRIASVISWLACDEAANVNGAMVTSDGGWSVA